MDILTFNEFLFNPFNLFQCILSILHYFRFLAFYSMFKTKTAIKNSSILTPFSCKINCHNSSFVNLQTNYWM